MKEARFGTLRVAARPGTRVTHEHDGQVHRVTLTTAGHLRNGTTEASLSPIAEAIRAGCRERQVRLVLPLASLAPDLVQAVVEGRVAAGYGIARLRRGLPIAWAERRDPIPVIAASQM